MIKRHLSNSLALEFSRTLLLLYILRSTKCRSISYSPMLSVTENTPPESPITGEMPGRAHVGSILAFILIRARFLFHWCSNAGRISSTEDLIPSVYIQSGRALPAGEIPTLESKIAMW